MRSFCRLQLGTPFRRTSVLVSLITLVSGCDWMPGKPKPEDRWQPDTAITDFGSLYQTQCAGCHSRDGRMAAARPLNDPVYRAFVDPKIFRHVIAQGNPGTTKPAISQSAGGLLTDAQIDILVQNLLAGADSDRATLRLPPYQAAPGDVQRGAVAFQTFCAKCHGKEGNGGPTGGSVVDPNYLALVSDQALRTAVVVGRVDLGMPDWRGLVSGRPMTDTEISDVVAWLISHRKK